MSVWLIKTVLTTFLLALLGSCVSTPPTAGPEPGGVLVTFAMPAITPEPTGGSGRVYHGGARAGEHWQVPLYTRQQVRRFARDYRLVQTGAWPIGVLGVYCVAFISSDGTQASELLPKLDADPRTKLVQINAAFQGMGLTSTYAKNAPIYDDPLLDIQYGEFVDKLEALHAITGGDAVRVGVIDTSVDLTHPDLFGQVARQIELVPAAEPAARLHGTAVTGVIAAAGGNGVGLVGLAPRANVHVYGACTENNKGALCTSFSIAQALADALDEGMQVINMSFAGPDDPLLAALLDVAVAAEIVLVAAGNSDHPAARFPAGHPGVHAADGERHLWFASPERLSTRAGGSYQMFSGSSIASAGMTGLAALLRARTSAPDTRAVLDWLFEGQCDPATQPAALEPFRREELCE